MSCLIRSLTPNSVTLFGTPIRVEPFNTNRMANLSAKYRLETSTRELLKHNKEGSFATHANRSERLCQSMRTLHEVGYTGLKDVRDLKTRHIDALVEHWKAQDLSAGTIKNRMSDLRWLARKIEKHNIVKRTNDEYNIERRQYVKNDQNIAKDLAPSTLERVTDERIKLSLKLQAAFGLRREESIKFQVKVADKGDHIKLQASWCKGGREREVPIRTAEQRELLNEVRQFCKDTHTKSLIPSDKSYYQQLRAYEYQTDRAGINKNHGLRHQYAQDRYRELTGREPPKCGGKGYRELTPAEREQDYQARLEISAELGHNREEVTAVYLGR